VRYSNQGTDCHCEEGIFDLEAYTPHPPREGGSKIRELIER